MKKIFEKIEVKAKAKGQNRYVTTVEAISNTEDWQEVLSAVLEYLDEVETRLKTLEKKK